MPLVRELQAAVLPGMPTASLRSLPPPDSVTTNAIVTLAQVRCGPRSVNEYVESPRPLPVLPLKSTTIGISPGSPSTRLPIQSRSSLLQTSRPAPVVGGGGGVGSTTGGSIISSQPAKTPPLKEGGQEEHGAGDKHSSIICSKCGKCRCAACTEPRELPSRWLCSNRYELSARKAIDCCTCFCCVQTAFYHCGAEEDNACYDDACKCGGSKCCSRWTCMAVSSVFLPCLWLYWPLRGCLAAVTSCYNSCCRKKGCECQCARRTPPDSVSKHSQTRRLLVESDSSSA